MPRATARGAARAVVIVFAATVALGVLLLVAFQPEIQTADAEELVDRRDDARLFLYVDFVFVALYAAVSPTVMWRFGKALTGGAAPMWIKLTVFLGVAAGLLDLAENTLLLSATDSVSEDAVDAAHAVAVPLTVLFVAGALLSLVVVARAVRALLR